MNSFLSSGLMYQFVGMNNRPKFRFHFHLASRKFVSSDMWRDVKEEGLLKDGRGCYRGRETLSFFFRSSRREWLSTRIVRGRWRKAFCENYYIEYWSEEGCYWQTLFFLRGMKGKKIEFGPPRGESRNMLYRQVRRLPSKPLIYTKLANKGPLLSSGTTSKEHELTRPLIASESSPCCSKECWLIKSIAGYRVDLLHYTMP